MASKLHKNTRALRKLMAAHELRAEDVSAIVNRKVTTVNIWRCKDNRRVIPSELLKLLELSCNGGGRA